jgi:hypothetical protein
MRTILAVILLLLCCAPLNAKKHTIDEYDIQFTVTGHSQSGPLGGHHYCPMTLQSEIGTMLVYSLTWQCRQYPIGSHLNGRMTTYPIDIMVETDAIEFGYVDNGKLKRFTFIVEQQQR